MSGTNGRTCKTVPAPAAPAAPAGSSAPAGDGLARGRLATVAFLREFLSAPNVVGALAPSSSALGRALVEPFRHRTRPSRVIEIGAGTGAVTRQLGEAIGPGDSIVICEMQQRLANVLESTVLKAPAFDQARREGRLVVHACAVQALPVDEPFDYAVCGLPFTAFCPKDIREIFRLVRGMLKPGGVFSYFEYVGMRRLRMALSMGEERKKMRRVSAVLDRHIRMYEWRRTFVARNFPPAYARHWRFDETAIPAQTGRRVQTARSFKA